MKKHFIHLDCYANDGYGDFERATRIEEVNTAHGLRFKTNKNYLDPPKPVPLDTFMHRFKFRYSEVKTLFTMPNIDLKTKEVLYNPLQEGV